MARSSLFKAVVQLIRMAQIKQRHHISSNDLKEISEISDRLCNPDWLQRKISRRSLLSHSIKAAATLPLLSLLPKRALAGGEPVVIVGGGIAGLVTAYRLMRLGIPCSIYEASSRIGGRMFSTVFNSEKMFAEMGGELVDTGHTALISLCKELQIELQNLYSEDQGIETDLFSIGGKIISSEKMLEAFQPLASELSTDWNEIFGDQFQMPTYKDSANPVWVKYDQMSLAEYLYTKKNVEKWVVDLLNTLYLCEYGMETGNQSALNFLTLISPNTGSTRTELDLLGESDEKYRITGGSSTLPEALRTAIEGTVPIHREHPLVQIKESSGRFHLTFLNGKTTKSVSAHQLVCALPFSVLRKVEGIDKINLRPQVLDCIQKFGYGTNSKLMMGFRSRAWRKTSNGSLLTVARQQFWETSRAQAGTMGILTNFLGGEMGADIPRFQDAHNLNLLEDVFPETRGQFDGQVVAMNWSKYQWTRGSYTCLRPGQYTRLHGLAAEPELSQRLFFAGEHTSIESSGFMNGAVESGNRVSDLILGSRSLF